MGLSFGHIALLLVIVLVVFGAGRLPQVMGDLGKGLRSFKDGLKEGEQGEAIDKKTLIADAHHAPSGNTVQPISSENGNIKSPDRLEA